MYLTFYSILYTIKSQKNNPTNMTATTKKKTPKKKPYLNNEDLLKELRKSHEQDQMTNELVKMMYLLIERIQRKLFYVQDAMKQDCHAHAMVVVVENWRKFNMEKFDNPFAYFTRTVFNALAQAWNRNESNKGHIHISLDAFINNDTESHE